METKHQDSSAEDLERIGSQVDKLGTCLALRRTKRKGVCFPCRCWIIDATSKLLYPMTDIEYQSDGRPIYFFGYDGICDILLITKQPIPHITAVLTDIDGNCTRFQSTPKLHSPHKHTFPQWTSKHPLETTHQAIHFESDAAICWYKAYLVWYKQTST